jgi:hypothetical protein
MKRSADGATDAHVLIASCPLVGHEAMRSTLHCIDLAFP